MYLTWFFNPSPSKSCASVLTASVIFFVKRNILGRIEPTISKQAGPGLHCNQDGFGSSGRLYDRANSLINGVSIAKNKEIKPQF
jgi:hypothetical protein